MKRRTHEEFVSEIFNLVGNEYSVIENYVHSHYKITLKHNACGFEWKVDPNSFLRGSRCPNCAGHLKKNTKIFKEEIFALVGEEYSLLDKYINDGTKLKMKHNHCEHEYYVTPSSFLRGRRCPKCFGHPKKTHEQFVLEVYDIYGYEYMVLGQYINSKTKIEVKHTKCNHIYCVSPDNILKGRRCPNCYGRFKWTTDKFKKEVFKLVENEYEVLGEYKDQNTKIKILHLNCNFITNFSPTLFLRGGRCPFCTKCTNKNTEIFKYEVFNLHGNEYEVVGDYITAKKYIKMKHKECGYVWDVCPDHFLNRGGRCPLCRSSNGEIRIKNFLDENHINYIWQHYFDDCRNKGLLYFDFAVFNENNELDFLVEFDGRQHFEPVDFAGKGEEWAKEQFEQSKIRDKIKNQYCVGNNISLLRISYWETDNIEELLLKKLNTK